MTNGSSTNPEKKPRATRQKKRIAQADDLTAEERRAIDAGRAGGPAENATIRISPLLREAAALAMAERGLSFSEYVNLLLARDAVRTMVALDDHPGEPISALDLTLATWAGDARRRMVNRVQLLREEAFPASERMQADALRSFMRAAASKAGRPLSREQLADAALEAWDAIHAAIGPKHIDRAALAACAARAAESLRGAPAGPALLEEFLAEARAKDIPPDVLIDAIRAAIARAAKGGAKR
ncbi:MAG: hypothetical protein J7605_17220 [Variovorax sp.]|nr:hypothetical protein [Variovorax sp.]